MDKRAKPIQFRPTPEARDWLEQMQSAGFEMTEILNGLVVTHGNGYVRESAKSRISKLQKVLAAR